MAFSSERLTSRPFVAAAAMGAARGLTFSKCVYGVSNPYDQAWCDSRAGRLAPPFLGGPMGAPLACSGCSEQELQASGAIRRAISSPLVLLCRSPAAAAALLAACAFAQGVGKKKQVGAEESGQEEQCGQRQIITL